MDFRKVQVTGGNSFVVSLPKSWVKEVGLRPKDAVAVITQPDDSLLIVPRRDLRQVSKPEAAIDVVSGMDRDGVLRHYISHYLTGYDVVRVNLGKADAAFRGAIRDGIRRKLVGVEIIEESPTALLTQCLSGYADLPLKKAVERMGIIASGMVSDSVAALRSDESGFAKEVIDRDDEVDRFYHFILRQLNIAIRDRSVIQEMGLGSARDCLGYRLVAKSVERVGDHAVQIASQAEALNSLPESSLKRIKDLAELSRKVFEGSVTALLRLDPKFAEEAIGKAGEVSRIEEKLSGEMLAARMNGAQVGSVRLVLESIRRIAEYGADISETALDLMVREP
ncbi:MAG: AbrB/MazE/SpoVT family DNA-binding domain-containing protein [archaeon]|nr:MAG: AbrB/MazE/SpoVT family DNA-binding domain-containing protein [archaeon]